jgi:putative ATPase
LDKTALLHLAEVALKKDTELKKRHVELKETEALLQYSGGDARKLLNALELVVGTESDRDVIITNDLVTEKLQENPAAYDKQGEMHYDIISAFIKSIRGSDPDAAVYWLARMIAGGEDPKFIARRLLISASEDIGLANPNALLLANACFDAVNKIGFPEARIVLSETAIYLASSPKSNSAYLAIDSAIEEVNKSTNLSVPLKLRNAPTNLMRDMQYGKGYKYPHDFEENFVNQEYMPKELKNRKFWHPQSNTSESRLSEFLKKMWGK